MDQTDQLASERRARLAAERLLAQMQSELGAANRQLSLHARKLSGEIVQSREEAGRALSEAESLKSEVSHVRSDLERAESQMVIAERRLWESLETIRDGFAVFDPNYHLIAANRAYLGLFEGLEMVRPGIHMSELVELLADEGIVDTGERTSLDWQSWMMRRLDNDRIAHATLKLWNGQYYQLIDRRTRDGDLVTLALNITEQTLREEQLRDAREKAEAANRAKSAFLANMSHEIRTPMNGVVAMADMMAETALDEEQRAYVDTIRSSGEALLVIINDVLDYSKIEADKISFKTGPFDLERCIHDVVTLLQPGALDKGLQLAVDYDLFMPTSYVGDAGRVRQILTNLVGNAIKFTEAGHVLIRVVGLPGEDGTSYRVHVTVEDTGIGIPEEKLESVFQEFQQVENDRDRTHDGTGLGLAITRKLVLAMGGEVWVDSREGVGSGFGFSLPLETVGDVEPEDVSAPPWLRRAIVLDDAGMNRTVLVKQLGLIGLQTVTASSIGDIRDAEPSSRDIVLLGQSPNLSDVFPLARELSSSFAPAGMFLLVSGPTKVPEGGMAFNSLLQRPVLRASLMDCLSKLEPPGDNEEVVQDVFSAAAPWKMPDVEVGPDAFSNASEECAPLAASDAALADEGPEVTERAPGSADEANPERPPAVASSDESGSDPTTPNPPDPDIQQEAETPDQTGANPVDTDATPRELDTQTSGATPEDQISQPPVPETGRRRMRVLAAEDNKTNRFVLEKMLKSLDIDLVFAENGVEAVASFKEARPDIFFTDISMPKMDGKEATRRIRALERSNGLDPCPIVAITAHAMDGDADDILAAGVDHYLTKPLKKQQLIEHILSAQPVDALPALPLPEDGLDLPDIPTPKAATAAE